MARRHQCLWALSLAAGTPCLTTASVVYRDIDDINLVYPGGESYGFVEATLLLDETGTTGIRFRVTWDTRQPVFRYFGANPILFGGVTSVSISLGDTHSPYRFSAGDVIAQDVTTPPYNFPLWTTDVGVFNASYPEPHTSGIWGGQGFMALRTPVDGGFSYGWIRIYATPQRISVYDYAFETTPNEPIPAGAVPAAPSLAALAACVCSVMRRQRTTG